MRAFGDVVQLLLLVFIIIIVVVVYTQLLFSAGDNVNRVGVRHYYACTHRGNMQDCQIKAHLQTQIHVKMQIQLQIQRQIQPKYRDLHWDSVNMQDCQISQTRQWQSIDTDPDSFWECLGKHIDFRQQVQMGYFFRN